MYLAIVFVLGIALMFSSVGVAVAMSGGLFGAAMRNPFVLIALSMMLLTLAASSFGLFVLQPPQWMLQRAGAAHPGYAGALLMGLGMGVVAAPCIGPIVLGLLLMVEKSGSALFGFALFFTLALGLGLPYIGLAMAAGHIRRLPRSGEWLTWVEHLFGFVLVGLALYFLDTVVPNNLMTRFLPYYAAGVGIYLGFISREGRSWRPFLVMRSALGVVAVAALAFMLYPRQAPEKLRFEPFNAGAARVGDRSAQAGADRFQRRLVYPVPRDGAFDLRRSVRGQRGQALRADEGESDGAGQKDRRTDQQVRNPGRADDDADRLGGQSGAAQSRIHRSAGDAGGLATGRLETRGCAPRTLGRGDPCTQYSEKGKMRAYALLGSFGREDA